MRDRTARRASRTRAALDAYAREIDRRDSRFGSTLIVEKIDDDAPFDAFAGRVLLTRADAPDAILSEYSERAGEVGAGGVFDAFSLLPATTGGEMIGILGLGGGTCARAMARHHPAVRMIGWELDPAIVELARRHFGVDELERSGTLRCETGDAFGGCAAYDGLFDGLVVDCFDENSTVVACLRDRETWAALVKKMKPGGRIVANVSTGRGKGARVEDAVACSQALADATTNEITLWRAGACGIYNELAFSGPPIAWDAVREAHPALAKLTHDWHYFSAPPGALAGSNWLANTLGL